MEQLRVPIGVNFFSEVVHVDINDVRRRVEAVVPDMFGNHRPGHDAPAMTHEVVEQGEFSGGQLDLLATAIDGTPRRIEGEIGDAQDR